MYKNNPQSITKLKREIIREIGKIKPQLWQNITEFWTSENNIISLYLL